MKFRILAIILLIVTASLGYFIYQSETQESRFNFKLGLDLTGGSELVYTANFDETNIADEDKDEVLTALQEVIERRVNAFGVGEPIIRIEESSIGTDGVVYRLAVELPNVTDIEEAKAQIGKTPYLEFRKLEIVQEDAVSVDEGDEEGVAVNESNSALGEADESVNEDEALEVATDFVTTGLDGQFIQGATLQFQGGQPGSGSVGSEPVVLLEFNNEGEELFAELTGELVGQPLAIFLDGELISAPIVRDQITDGNAVISGSKP